jgi:hypothetical protein
MVYTERFKTMLEERIPNSKEVIYDFFITFSRFESALQNTTRFIKNDTGEANWDIFASSIRMTFKSGKSKQLKEAVNYILENPPKRIAEKDGRLVWEDSILGKKEPEAHKLNIYIRRIRNNVLHGGKFNGVYSPESRNFRLINYALVVLNDWLDYDKEVRENFLKRIE